MKNNSYNITLLCYQFEEVHLGKDVFLVPYHLGKQYGYNVDIVFPATANNRELPSTLKGVRLKKLSMAAQRFKFNNRWNLYFIPYLLLHSRKIDLLMRFHYTNATILTVLMYKLLNPKGKVYVKADGISDILAKDEKVHNLKGGISRFFHKRFARNVDVFSCETQEAYQQLCSSASSAYMFKNIAWLPNGFDEELLQTLHIKERRFSEKENLIITVGRLGSYPKNTEMLLKALEKVKLKDNWKVCLIGPVDEENNTVKTFIEENWNESIQFVGNITDKKELWEYYNRAKVFVLTSRWESYGLVLNEAYRFRNYLISTDVGAINDIYENGKYGSIINQDDFGTLSLLLNDITAEKIDIDVYGKADVSRLAYTKLIENIKI